MQELLRIVREQRFAPVQRVLGVLLMLFSLTHLVPLLLALAEAKI